MNYPIPNPDGLAVIELQSRATDCAVAGCGGRVVRHSLGEGQSIYRCTRCFRRYQVREDMLEADARKGRIRRMFDEFVAWRE